MERPSHATNILIGFFTQSNFLEDLFWTSNRIDNLGGSFQFVLDVISFDLQNLVILRTKNF